MTEREAGAPYSGPGGWSRPDAVPRALSCPECRCRAMYYAQNVPGADVNGWYRCSGCTWMLAVLGGLPLWPEHGPEVGRREAIMDTFVWWRRGRFGHGDYARKEYDRALPGVMDRLYTRAANEPPPELGT